MPVWLIVLISGITLSTILIGICVLIDKFGTPFSFSTEETLGILTGAFGGICIVMTAIATPLVASYEEEYYDIQYESIHSIRGTNNDLEGGFFLGTGDIEETTYYYVFVEGGHGYKLEKYDSRVTHIVEVEEGPYYTVRFKEKWSKYDEYILYVPVGTIIVEYKI